MISVRLSIK